MKSDEDKKNLQYYDTESGRTNAEIWVSEIAEYAHTADMIILKQEYAGLYVSPKLRYRSTSFIAFEGYTNVYRYDVKNTTNVHVSVSITMCTSPRKSQELWLSILARATSPYIPRSIENGIYVGDIAIGSKKSLIFVRANIMVDISVRFKKESDNYSIVEMAQEIDQQILDSIAEKEKQKNEN